MKGKIPDVLVGSGRTDGYLELHNGNILEVGSDKWFEWLSRNTSFRFVSGFAGEDSFTARKHERDSGEFWYAYRKVAGKLKNSYLGKSESLSVDKLLAAALKLSGVLGAATSKKQLGNGYANECITEQLGTDQENNFTASGDVQNLQEQLTALQFENEQMRSQLEKLKSSEQDLTNQLCNCHADALKAADILKAALKLRSNAGGAIKREIEKALPLIDDI